MPELTFDEWREVGRRKLDAQAARANYYQNYYDNENLVTALINQEERQNFRTFLKESRANWCELVVNAVAERLQVVGFRFGPGNISGAHAWEIWQGSSLDADAELAQTDALVAGNAFALVNIDEENPTGVEISGESPTEACVIYEPGSRRERVAGYKRYRIGNYTTEIVILPDAIVTWESSDAPPEVEANPTGVVNLVEIQPQPRSTRPPRSELHSAIHFQDRINTTIFNRLVATDYGAFRQIWATGVKLARETLTLEDGTTKISVIKPFDVGANRLLTNENPDARFGSFTESTLRGYLDAVGQDVEQLAATTQTPPHYLLGTMVNISADAIKAAEAGLVAKVSRRARHIGEAWEEVMRIALRLTEDPNADDVGAEVIWKDFETRSEAQMVDALVKMSTLGVPTEILWQRWGATPQEIEQWKQMKANEGAQAALNQAVALGATDPYAQLLAGGTAGTGP
jgi:hypothetical protein